MKAKKLTIVSCLASRFSLLCLLIVCGLTSAFAQKSQVLYFEAGDLVLGQENSFSIVLDNKDEQVAALQFKLVLPEGVSVKSLVPNRERLTRVHRLDITKQNNFNEYVVSVLPEQVLAIKGNEGEIAKLNLQLSNNFNLGSNNGEFEVSEVVLANRIGNKVYTEEFADATFSYLFKPTIGTLYAEQSEIEIYNGEQSLVNVAFENCYASRGLQFDLQLPMGLSLEKDADGLYVFQNGDRIPNHSIDASDLGNGKFRVVVNSFDGWSISGLEKSHLLGFNVVAAKDFDLAGGDIIIDNIVVADEAGYSYSSAKTLSVKVKNLTANLEDNKAAFERLNKEINEQYQVQLDSIKALDKAANVKDLIEKSQKAIDALSVDVKKAFDDKQLKKDSQLDAQLKVQAENALGAVNLELIFADFNAVEMDVQLSEQKANALGYAQDDKFLSVNQQLNSLKRNLNYSPVADFAKVDVVKAVYEDLAKVVVDLKALANEINGAAFDSIMALGFDGKDLVNAYVGDKEFIEEDIAKFAPVREALVAKYVALAAEHNALLDQDALVALNAELDAFRADLKKDRALPGFLDMTNESGKPTVQDVANLVVYVQDKVEWPTDELEVKRMKKRADVNGDGQINVQDITNLVNMIQ